MMMRWRQFKFRISAAGLLFVAWTFVLPGIPAATALADEDLDRLIQELVDEGLDDPFVNEKEKRKPAEPPPQPATAAEPDDLHEPLSEAITGLDAGLEQAQIAGRPVLVFITGQACPWCHRLKAELRRASVKAALERWILVEIDVDDSPDAAKRLGVSVLPALRVLRDSGAGVASHDGFLSADDLVQWLDENYPRAVAEVDDVLLADREINVVSVARLVQLLEDRDPLVREAAIARLTHVPQLAGGPIIEAFHQGKLATRLAAIEVLSQWDAPLADVDPWQPGSINDDLMARLTAWSDTFEVDGEADQRPLSDEELANIQQEIDRLLKLSVADGAPLAARLARHSAAILPEVYRRLESAENDDLREKLLALRYRLVANDALVLRFPGGLGRLASRDALTRRKAAQRLAGLATAADQPLLLELFSDPDPLIRETALRGLQQVGGEAATQSLVQLLADPEPNVRAAVLKQLAEQKSASLVPDVAQYVESEQDADLLVHAIRFFREVRGEGSAKALLPLLEHEAWQVRAESAEALREMLDGKLKNQPDLIADIYAGLIERLEDDDPFVVSRAIDALSREVTEVMIQPLLSTAERHPDLAPQIITRLSGQTAKSSKIHERMREFAEHESAPVRAAAINGLHTANSESLAEWGPVGLRDEASQVRLAVSALVFKELDGYRGRKHSGLAEPSSTTHSDDPFGEPPSLFQQTIGAWFPSGKGAAAVEEEIAEEAPAEQEPPETREDETSEKKTPVDDRWDRWLEEFTQGRGRADYFGNLTLPLTQMLSSEDPKERLAAALTLVPLGQKEVALPVLRELVSTDDQYVGPAADVLPWLPWDQRREWFEQLNRQASTSKARRQINTALAKAFDIRATELLWPLLASDEVEVEVASSISSALTTVYYGQSYWRGGDISPAARVKVLTDVEPHLESPHDWEALVALVHLAYIDKSRTAAIALELAKDETRGAQFRTDAFQIALAVAPSEQQTEMAQAALAGDQPKWQRLALIALVGERDQELQYLYDYSFHLPGSDSTGIYIESRGGPIIPTPPPGIAVEDVRPLIASTDAKTRAYAGYVLAVLGEMDGLQPLIDYWSDDNKNDRDIRKLVYRAIAKLNAADRIDVLREIQGTIPEFDIADFYWTIRIMSGDDVLRLRKEIRDKYGMNRLL